MREIGILLSTPMVAATQAGNKTMTRRTQGLELINDEPGSFRYMGNSNELDIPRPAKKYDRSVYYLFHKLYSNQTDYVCVCPWKVGDVLWVREEHYRYGHWIPEEGEFTKTGKQKWMFIGTTNEVRYFDNLPPGSRSGKRTDRVNAWYKRLGRFMFKSHSRLRLVVTDIRVERLQEISEEDAKAEGVRKMDGEPADPKDWKLCPDCGGEGLHGALGDNLGYMEVDCSTCDTYKKRFKHLWNSINGNWDLNPWVWVVSYKIKS